jgi:hypothetical protein
MHGLIHVSMYVRTRHRSRARAPARYDGGGQARCLVCLRRAADRIRVPASSLASIESRVVPEGGGTHAGHLHATVRVCIYMHGRTLCRAR